MNYIEVDNATEAFEYWYKLLDSQNLKASSRDGGVKGEVINAVTVIKDPTRGIVQSDIRKMPLRYAVGELMWYLSGNRNLSAIQNYTSAWDRMSAVGVTYKQIFYIFPLVKSVFLVYTPTIVTVHSFSIIRHSIPSGSIVLDGTQVAIA